MQTIAISIQYLYLSIMKAIEEKGHNDHFMECSIHGHKVSDLRLANDTTLLSYTNKSVQNLVESVKTHSERKHLTLKVKKAKVMKTDKAIDSIKIKVNSKILETGQKTDIVVVQ